MPPKLVDAKYDNGTLKLVLDRPVHQRWVRALHNMGSFGNVMGVPPAAFNFQGAEATVSTRSNDAQSIITYFKTWLPLATQGLRSELEREIHEIQHRRETQLMAEKKRHEENLRINSILKI